MVGQDKEPKMEPKMQIEKAKKAKEKQILWKMAILAASIMNEWIIIGGV